MSKVDFLCAYVPIENLIKLKQRNFSFFHFFIFLLSVLTFPNKIVRKKVKGQELLFFVDVFHEHL